MEKSNKPSREALRKLLKIFVEGDMSGEGEDFIDTWENLIEMNDREYVSVYKLTPEDIEEIENLIGEFRASQEQEQAEREKRRIAEEEADAIIATHYAERIRKIILSKPNDFLPEPEASKPKRPRGN